MRTDFEVQCPFCFEPIWMEFYPEDGDDQEMVIDCEVCCKPILYRVKFRGEDEPSIQVDRSQ
jgi:hypothetical protein